MTIASRAGFTCAYTPLPLLHAAGLVPYRILPVGDAPDQAGALLHDNLCPHVKRLLDRAMEGDLPDLSAVVGWTPIVGQQIANVKHDAEVVDYHASSVASACGHSTDQ